MTVSSYTSAYNFRLIDFNSATWHDDEWANWRYLDSLLGTVIGITNIQGIWENSLAVAVGERYIDDDDGTLWEVDIAHTTASSGTFSADRTANPTYWTQITSGVGTMSSQNATGVAITGGTIVGLTNFETAGIDDNATAERLDLTDSALTLGASGVTYIIQNAENDGFVRYSGGTDGDNGLNVTLYGGAHATLANDWLIRADTTDILHYDHSLTTFDFQANDILTTGALTAGTTTVGTFTSTGIDDNATGEVFQLGDGGVVQGPAGMSSAWLTYLAVDDKAWTWSGGNAWDSGAAITLRGGSNTNAGDLLYYVDGVQQFIFDYSATLADFGSWDITTTGTITGVAGSGIAADTITQGQHTIWLPASVWTPTTTNGAATATEELASNDLMLVGLDFDAATEEYATYMLNMPKSWDEGTFVVEFFWTDAGTAGTGDVTWGITCLSVGDNDAMDAAPGTAREKTDTFITSKDLHVTGETGALTPAGTPATEDIVILKVYRKAADGSDTYTQDARLLGVKIHYTTDADTDD